MKQIIISGSFTYDYIMTIPERLSNHILPEHLDTLNLSLIAATLRKSRGGTAANIGYTLNRLKVPPLMVGEIGSDGLEYLAYWKEKGVSTKYIGVDRHSLTASVYIVTDRDGKQISVYYGGMDPLVASGISKMKEKIEFAIISPSGNTHRHLLEAAALGIKTIFDPGQWSTTISDRAFREMVSKAVYFMGNEYEAEVLMQKTGWSIEQILKKLSLVVITKGRKGSALLLPDGSVIHVPACKPKKVVDPTGVGDAYRGGFLAGLARGFDLAVCAEMGSVAATYCIERAGCQEHHLAIQEFSARYQKTDRKKIRL